MLFTYLAYACASVSIRLLTLNPKMILRFGYAIVPFCGMMLLSEFIIAGVQLGARRIISHHGSYVQYQDVMMYVVPDFQPLLRFISFHTRVMMWLYLMCIVVELTDAGCPDTWLFITSHVVTFAYEFGVHHDVASKMVLFRFVALLLLHSTISLRNVCYAGLHYLQLLRVMGTSLAMVHLFTVKLSSHIHWYFRLSLRCVVAVALCGTFYIVLALMQTVQEGLVHVAASFVTVDPDVLSLGDITDIQQWYVNNMRVSRNVVKFMYSLRV